MTLTFFGPLVALIGAAALGLGLFLLQRLRVRHRELEVVTTIFWREAAEERRTSVLVRRFRHLLAYLLLISIALLLWLLIGGPRISGQNRGMHFVLIDDSSTMHENGGFDRAVDIASRITAGLADDQREVQLVAGSSRTVLAPGEPLPLLRERINAHQILNAPTGFDAAVQSIWAMHAGSSEDLHVHLVGNAEVRSRLRSRLPDSMKVHRFSIEPSPDQQQSRFAAIGVAESASGEWRSVDVFVEIEPGPASIAIESLRVSLGGQPWPQRAERAGDREFVWRDVPARGEDLIVQLAGATTGGAAETEAAIRLPDRPLIRVFAEDGIPGSILTVLSLDTAVEIVPDVESAEVIVGAAPAASFQLAASLDVPAFLLTHADRLGDESVDAMIDLLAIRQIDATSLATQAQREIRLDVQPGDRRQISVWRELFDSTYDFQDSRAFPLFISRSIRWLANRPALMPWSVADEPLPVPGSVVQRPATAGMYSSLDGRTMQVSLVGAGGDSDDLREDEAEVPGSPLPDLFGILGLFLLCLTVTEWILHRTGRMP